MCRFSRTGDAKYRTVAAAIERVLQNLPTKLQPGMESGSRNINILTDVGQSKDSQALRGLRQAIQSEYPFLEYATTNALVHSNQVQSVGVAQNDFVTVFPLQRWIKLSNVFEKFQARRYTNEARFCTSWRSVI